jgi:hypothetical protein
MSVASRRTTLIPLRSKTGREKMASRDDPATHSQRLPQGHLGRIPDDGLEPDRNRRHSRDHLGNFQTGACNRTTVPFDPGRHVRNGLLFVLTVFVSIQNPQQTAFHSCSDCEEYGGGFHGSVYLVDSLFHVGLASPSASSRL